MDAKKYQGKYRIASARLATWDYGSNAAYFVTICTQDRVHAFGDVADSHVNLTGLGQAAWDCWYAIPEHFPFVVLGEFVAMPNHVHGIVIIDKPSIDRDSVETYVETQNFASLPQQYTNRPQNQFGPQSQNLASIVRGFKIGVTKYARQHQISFAWQARYHDHIIRDAAEYGRIAQYIVENPQKWTADRFYNR
ncbi:MAG: transposase [Caldilineaceae bacterium]|nr:transposase [Caldilineaceae bacterium]